MLHVFHLNVAMTIQVCFNSILYKLQWLDGCCRGDEMLGQGKGHGRDSAAEDQGAAGMAPRRGEERVRRGRNVAWAPFACLKKRSQNTAAAGCVREKYYSG